MLGDSRPLGYCFGEIHYNQAVRQENKDYDARLEQENLPCLSLLVESVTMELLLMFEHHA